MSQEALVKCRIGANKPHEVQQRVDFGNDLWQCFGEDEKLGFGDLALVSAELLRLDLYHLDNLTNYAHNFVLFYQLAVHSLLDMQSSQVPL